MRRRGTSKSWTSLLPPPFECSLFPSFRRTLEPICYLTRRRKRCCLFSRSSPLRLYLKLPYVSPAVLSRESFTPDSNRESILLPKFGCALLALFGVKYAPAGLQTNRSTSSYGFQAALQFLRELVHDGRFQDVHMI